MQRKVIQIVCVQHVVASWYTRPYICTCIVCDNVAENYRLDITYENNLIIKLVLVGIQLFMRVVIVCKTDTWILFKLCRSAVYDYSSWLIS